jgi:hypothetical protein
VKTSILILISLSLLISKDFVVTKGIGTNRIKVGKTNVKSAISSLGKDYQVIKHDQFLSGRAEINGEYWVNTGEEYFRSDIRITYLKTGISFQFSTEDPNYDPKNDELTLIEHLIFEGPSTTKTSDNIILNVSSIHDIRSKYGQWESSNTEKDISDENPAYRLRKDTIGRYYIHYNRQGISFGLNSKTHKVSLIDIYLPNGRPYCK